MKGTISWIIIAAAGFSLMAFSYFSYQYQPGPNPWKNAFMYIGKADPNTQTEGLEYVKRPIRLLPISRPASHFTQVTKGFGSYVEKSYRAIFQEKLILYPDITDDFNDSGRTAGLEWGRLPQPDVNEVAAGYYTENKSEIDIDGQVFKVVGRLKKDVRLFVNSYLFSNSAAAGRLFDSRNEAVQNAYVFQLPKEKLTSPEILEQLKSAFPKSQFIAYAPLIKTEKAPFYLYMLGLALLLSGGSVILFKVYCLLAEKIENKWLRLPLAEIRKYGRLFIGLHLVYFGLVILFMLLVHSIPELQASLLAGIKSQVSGGSGPLAVAGKAYMSKSIPRAAITTFGINFILGSLAYITIPSVIIPGIGLLGAVFRASMWGLLLAPSFDTLAATMLPHSFTLLLEGEAYIVATFFALLIPIYIFRKSEGPNFLNRYGRALAMNIRGNLLVAIVLVIAAIYEATEVILMMII